MDYTSYLESIDAKLGQIITNQRTIQLHQTFVNQELQDLNNNFFTMSCFLFICLFTNIFYNFYHRIFCHRR